ncbi:MND1-interacting protein 1-like [Tasmannia lanceolata]|uniref:MND1-interacting protein 1-like n=1 Tax=Tasmannia lanceolata TaxID=3420 RepID=UPI00406320A8
MGRTVREKSIQNNRKLRSSIKPDNSNQLDRASIPGRNPNPNLDAANDGEKGGRNPNARNPNPNFVDDNEWGYYTEDQLEELLLRNLDFIYTEAVSKLVSLGYDKEVALKSILRNGNWYGSMDVLMNILHNAISYMNSSSTNNRNPDELELGFSFTDLRQLGEYSLGGMVCLIQQVRPQFSKAEAMWCLLMSDLHVGRASTMEIPAFAREGTSKDATVSSNAGGVPGLCKFHEGWVFGRTGLPANESSYDATATDLGHTLTSDIESLNRFNLSPSMMSLLKRNVSSFVAGFRANSKAIAQSQSQSHACPSSSSSNEPPISPEKNVGTKDSQNSDFLSSILGSLGNMSIKEKSGVVTDHQHERILNLILQIRELEGQVKERREWAHQKAIQAARKLSNDLNELKILRMEREETLRLMKGKQALEDTTTKSLSEIENAMRNASSQVDHANAIVKRLETENAEIRAEMEAYNLSASESVTTLLEVEKREKKGLKRLLAWEKQKSKMQEEVGEEKQKVARLEQQIQLFKDAHKETEMKWRQDQKAKELAIEQVEKERRAKEAAKANVKTRQEVLRRKIEIDIQRYKDDIQRLEQELSRLKVSAELCQPSVPSNTSSARESDVAKMPKETNARIHHELHKVQEVSHDRECLICMKDEVSIVFLPCAHQVLCVNCNDDHEKNGKTKCPCCGIQIEQRIHVYGTSS